MKEVTNGFLGPCKLFREYVSTCKTNALATLTHSITHEKGEMNSSICREPLCGHATPIGSIASVTHCANCIKSAQEIWDAQGLLQSNMKCRVSVAKSG
jgi:hypothetical protein